MFKTINLSDNGTINNLTSEEQYNLYIIYNDSEIRRKIGKVELSIEIKIENITFVKTAQGFVLGRYVFINYKTPSWLKVLLIGGVLAIGFLLTASISNN